MKSCTLTCKWKLQIIQVHLMTMKDDIRGPSIRTLPFILFHFSCLEISGAPCTLGVPIKKHKRIDQKFHKKYGWIYDAIIYHHAKFDDEQNFLKGEIKMTNQCRNRYGFWIHIPNLFACWFVFFCFLHKILLILKFCMMTGHCIIYPSIFLVQFSVHF